MKPRAAGATAGILRSAAPRPLAVARTARRAFVLCAAAPQPSAVISGASSGIGKAAAVAVANSGWRVFAGVRSDAAADELRSLHPSIQPIKLDVASAASVKSAAVEVRAAVGPAGVQGLVNNAGFGIFTPVECFSEEDWESIMNVNVTGVLRCTKAFLPMLRAGERKGRIVQMSSIAGSVSLPLFGAYAASKHALEAMSDAMRYELRDQGVQVSIIKPGPVVTDIWRRGREGSARVDVGPEGERLYGGLIERTERLTRESEANGIPADDVAALVVEALTAPRPRARYVIGRGAPVFQVARRLLPDWLFDPLIINYYKAK